MAGGRPTSYNDEVLSLAHEYLVCYEGQGEAIPSIVGLCRYIGRGKTTVYNWLADKDDEKKDEFRDIAEEIEELQHIKLVSGGLVGGYNPMITKLMLSKHGYSDSVKTDITSGGEKLAMPVYNVVEE